MKGRLKKLIETENKKNPYTDEQLAELLDLRRDAVTVLRGELNIPDSRERRKPYLIKEIREVMLNNPEMSNRQLTRAIKERGFDVSRYLISQMTKDMKEKMVDTTIRKSSNEP